MDSAPTPPAPTPSSTVTLRTVERENLRALFVLDVSDEQQGYVAPNAWSIAEAAHSQAAWERAIYADETPVGYVLVSADEAAPTYYLWRFMIDHRYQGNGFARAAMEQVINHVRTLRDATEFVLSYVPGDHSPKGFYERLGFVDTGEVIGVERVMKMDLA
jgi:diamine N-acetyltransferase